MHIESIPTTYLTTYYNIYIHGMIICCDVAKYNGLNMNWIAYDGWIKFAFYFVIIK